MDALSSLSRVINKALVRPNDKHQQSVCKRRTFLPRVINKEGLAPAISANKVFMRRSFLLGVINKVFVGRPGPGDKCQQGVCQKAAYFRKQTYGGLKLARWGY